MSDVVKFQTTNTLVEAQRKIADETYRLWSLRAEPDSFCQCVRAYAKVLQRNKKGIDLLEGGLAHVLQDVHMRASQIGGLRLSRTQSVSLGARQLAVIFCAFHLNAAKGNRFKVLSPDSFKIMMRGSVMGVLNVVSTSTGIPILNVVDGILNAFQGLPVLDGGHVRLTAQDLQLLKFRDSLAQIGESLDTHGGQFSENIQSRLWILEFGDQFQRTVKLQMDALLRDRRYVRYGFRRKRIDHSQSDSTGSAREFTNPYQELWPQYLLEKK